MKHVSVQADPPTPHHPFFTKQKIISNEKCFFFCYLLLGNIVIFFPKARAIRAKAGCSPFGKWQDATRLNLVKDWLQLGLTLASNISFNIPQLCQDLAA